MDAPFLADSRCYFAGGTAIALQLGEFRESVDVDFLCADREGYRLLRAAVFDSGLSALFPHGVETLREVRADRDGVRAILAIDGVPIKFEIVREARIALSGEAVEAIPVPCLSRTDLYAEKLLANADRCGDKAAMSRDIVDLLMMTARWGTIPDAAWAKARDAYGSAVDRACEKALALLDGDAPFRDSCFVRLGIDPSVQAELLDVMADLRPR